MELAVSLPNADGAMSPDQVAEFARVADDLGYHSVWMGEALGFDAFMVLAVVAVHTRRIRLGIGIANVYSRSPAQIAQSAATLDALSEGRAILGLGVSGPQVIEGWHGMPYSHPLQRTSEVIDIVRTVMRRAPLEYSGDVFRLSSRLRLMNRPVRDSVPIAVASLGPKNVELTAEKADVWLPMLYSPGRAPEVFRPRLESGRRRREAALAPLATYVNVDVAVADDTEWARGVARNKIALYVGGMGSRDANFYNQMVRRYGFVDAAMEIQNLFLSGRRQEAVAAVPDGLVDEVCAIGTSAHVKDRLAEFSGSGADVVIATLVARDHDSRLRMLADLVRSA